MSTFPQRRLFSTRLALIGALNRDAQQPFCYASIQDWVFGGRAADTDRRSFGASRPDASRSQQHTVHEEPSREARARDTEGGGGHRASDASSSPTRGHYQYVRDCGHSPQERSGREKKRRKSTQKGL